MRVRETEEDKKMPKHAILINTSSGCHRNKLSATKTNKILTLLNSRLLNEKQAVCVCVFFIFLMFIFAGKRIWDDLPTQSEMSDSESTSNLSISDLLTNVATDANEGNRYVHIYPSEKKFDTILFLIFPIFLYECRLLVTCDKDSICYKKEARKTHTNDAILYE